MDARFDLVPLSPREREALRLKLSSYTRAETSRKLGVTENRVKNIWQSIRRKMKRNGVEIPPELGVQRIRQVSLSGYLV